MISSRQISNGGFLLLFVFFRTRFKFHNSSNREECFESNVTDFNKKKLFN